ncbi:MAG: hypothetical protein NC039_08880 [Muribaculaceae bacterium]|nr:hypothetical protein [Muribaculaceae bacterium]
MSEEFKLIDFLIKSRMLFNTVEEYGALIGMDVKSFLKVYRDKPGVELSEIYGRVEEECRNQCGYGPHFIRDAYVRASDICTDAKFWGGRKHKTSRKKFCRWMFLRANLKYTDFYSKYPIQPHEEDLELLSRFVPEHDLETINVALTLLMTYDVVRPYGTSTSRFYDYDGGSSMATRLVGLLETVMEDLPDELLRKTTGAVFSRIDVLRHQEDEANRLTVARAWEVIDEIADSIRLLESAEELAETRVVSDGYAMHGIWVDDRDDGLDRFWIFPDNKLMAFCYSREGTQWHLQPYEFCFYRRDYENEFSDICAMVTARGNYQVLRGGSIGKDEMVFLNYELSHDDHDNEELTGIRFASETGMYPAWMTWRSFNRLPKGDKLYREYRAVLDRIYNPESEMLSEPIKNIASWLTDAIGCLTAVDYDYLYISARFGTTPHFLTTEPDGQDAWLYLARDDGEYLRQSLRAIEVSDEQPLYLIPRSQEIFADTDKGFEVKELVRKSLNEDSHNDTPAEMARRKALAYRVFKECACLTELGDQITIYNAGPRREDAVLCFNRFSKTFLLSTLADYGVVRITSRQEFFE